MSELDLDTACRLALSENPGLEAVRERILQAREALQQARSGYWPSLELQGSGTRFWLSESARQAGQINEPFGSGVSNLDSPDEASRAGLTASWLVFDGLERRYRAAAARFGLERSRAADQEAARLLLAAVAEAFYQAQLAGEDRSIARADEAFNERQLTEAKARRKRGAGSLSDVYNFEIRVNAARAERIRAEERLSRARAGLGALLAAPGASLSARIRVAGPKPVSGAEFFLPGMERERAFARQHRPDLKESRASVAQAESEVNAARAAYFPSFRLSYTLEGERGGLALPEEADVGHSLALVMRWNLFDGWAKGSKVRQAKSRYRETVRTRQEVELQLGREVQESLAELESARDRLRLERENLGLVRRTRDLVLKEYQAGQASLVRLNEAQRDLIAAEGRLVLSLVSLRLSRFRLDVDTGRVVSRFREQSGTQEGP
jgi:outer membrane protein TolC